MQKKLIYQESKDCIEFFDYIGGYYKVRLIKS